MPRLTLKTITQWRSDKEPLTSSVFRTEPTRILVPPALVQAQVRTFDVMNPLHIQSPHILKAQYIAALQGKSSWELTFEFFLKKKSRCVAVDAGHDFSAAIFETPGKPNCLVSLSRRARARSLSLSLSLSRSRARSLSLSLLRARAPRSLSLSLSLSLSGSVGHRLAQDSCDLLMTVARYLRFLFLTGIVGQRLAKTVRLRKRRAHVSP